MENRAMEKAVVATVPAMVYRVDDIEVNLTTEKVKNFLVRGKPELINNQEVMFFMHICRAMGLNPMAGDCYLIKYNADPAAIVVSIDFKRKRARYADDCQGWKKGVIVKTASGQIVKTAGLVLDDETLIGGWFEATPKGWSEPFRLEVNLRGYIKKTFDGKVTKFWQQENQATMIAKVAESQGLSAVWPRDLEKLYTADEVPEQMTYEMEPEQEQEAPKKGNEGAKQALRPNPEKPKPEPEQQDEAERTGKDVKTILKEEEQKRREREEMEKKIKAAEERFKATAQQPPPPPEDVPFPGFDTEPSVTAPLKRPPASKERVNKKTGEVAFGDPVPKDQASQTPADNGDAGKFVVCSKKGGDEMTRGFCRNWCNFFLDPKRCSDYMSDKF